jgi:hypothetical protein
MLRLKSIGLNEVRRVASLEFSRGFQATGLESQNQYFVASATMEYPPSLRDDKKFDADVPGLERPG